MRWTPGQRSGNLEDRRGQSGGGFPGMGGFRLGGAGGLGCGGTIIVLLLSLFFGPEFLSLLGGGGGPVPDATTSAPGAPPADTTPEEERMVDFVDFVQKDAQETWRRLLPQDYRDTKLVLFRDAFPSACGLGQAAMGPFYCPGDEKVYLDLSFYDDLQRRFGAAGDFAQAYVIAHEIGHHVQNVLGIERQVRQAQQQDPSQRNALSVAMELQADCFAGVWGHSTARRDILEEGDVEEGLNAAAAIGDDRIQERTQGQVVPESFTHGSSEQRATWFRRGLESGNPESCDTFSR
jgi:predicted metalloprotease